MTNRSDVAVVEIQKKINGELSRQEEIRNMNKLWNIPMMDSTEDYRQAKRVPLANGEDYDSDNSIPESLQNYLESKVCLKYL